MNVTLENDADLLFAEMRAELPQGEEVQASFQPLPSGVYQGRVYIVVKTVNNQDSPNYGRKKYEIQLTVTEGDQKGKMAYNHRVILPSYLGNKPPESDANSLNAWQERVKAYMRKTDEILRNCGVDTADTDMNRFVKKIGENNLRRPTVNFTMRNSVAYINYPLNDEKRDGAEALAGNLFEEEVALPDGNDLVLA